MKNKLYFYNINMDFYNMSSAISSGDMRGEETSNMNDRIRESNKAKIIAQKNAVSQLLYPVKRLMQVLKLRLLQ